MAQQTETDGGKGVKQVEDQDRKSDKVEGSREKENRKEVCDRQDWHHYSEGEQCE